MVMFVLCPGNFKMLTFLHPYCDNLNTLCGPMSRSYLHRIPLFIYSVHALVKFINQ